MMQDRHSLSNLRSFIKFFDPNLPIVPDKPPSTYGVTIGAETKGSGADEDGFYMRPMSDPTAHIKAGKVIKRNKDKENQPQKVRRLK